MKRLWAILLSLSALGLQAASSPAVPTINDFFSLPNIRQPRLSPDGTKIAFLFPHENKMALGVFDRGTKESRMVVRGTDESIKSFFWKGSDRIVFLADFQGDESSFIGSTDLSGRTIVRLAETQPGEYIEGGSAASIIDELPADPDRVVAYGYFQSNDDIMQHSSTGSDVVLARLNVHNRGISPLYVFRPSDRIVRTIVDNAGVLRLRSRLEKGRDLVWELRDTDERGWQEIARHPFHGYAETWDPVRFSVDNVTLWLISREENDRGVLYAYNTRTHTRGPAIFVPPEGEIYEIITSYDRAKLLGVSYESDELHYHWFDAGQAKLHAMLESTFKGCDVRVVSTSADEAVAIVAVTYDREPGTYFILDRKAGSLVLFKRVRDIDPTQLSTRRPIVYTARDGLPIHGYLTIPRGKEGQRVPLIIHPHGGPFGIRDSAGYDTEAQFLASRGYAVLQPNYRGSGGYGRDFIDKGRCQWGRAMQDDLTDGVKWAITQGIADPARIAIYGASYGGYATLAGLALTPELYCCGVNYVGPTDLDIINGRGVDAYLHSDDFDFRQTWVGPTAEYRSATSPVNLVDRIRVPLLNAYGEHDVRVKIDHWNRLEPKLKKYGKTYEIIDESRQGHGFYDEKAAVGFYGHLETFLAKYLKPSEPSSVPGAAKSG